MKKQLSILLLILYSVALASAQQSSTLLTGQPVERSIAGGEAQTFQITLTAGQFMRVLVEQRGIDVKLALSSPDGKPVVESDLTGIFGLAEPLSYEASAAGTYQLVIRANGAATANGAYQARLDVKASAGDQDRKRISAESLMNEARQLNAQGKFADPQLGAKAGQALASFQELGDVYMQALTINLIGLTRARNRQFDKAIEAYEQALPLWRAEKLRPGEAAVLTNMGDANRSLGRNEKTIEYYDQALAIHREVKNRIGEGLALNVLGQANASLSRREKAIEYYEQSLVIFRELKNRAVEGDVLNNLGSACFGLRQYERARESFAQAVTIYREVKNRAGEANALSNLGLAYGNLDRYETAIETHEQALAIFRELKNRASEGRSLYNLAGAYAKLRRYEKVIEYCDQSLIIFREVKNRDSEGDMLNLLGVVHDDLSRYEKAIEYYEQALAVRRELKDRGGEGNVLNNLAGPYLGLGRYEKAVEYNEQALAIYREMKNRRGEATALNNLGSAVQKLGRYDQSINYYELARAIYREMKDRAAEGETLNGLGITYRRLGQFEKAIEHYEQARLIAREAKDRRDEGNALGNLGTIYIDLGRYEKAIEYFEQALVIHREVKNRVGEANVLNTLGGANDSLGRHEKAIEYFEQALAIRREIKDRGGEGGAINNLAISYKSLSRNEKAIESAEQALTIFREVKDRSGERDSLDVLGSIYYNLKRYDKAIESHQQALVIDREIRSDESITLSGLARSEFARGDLSQARTHIEESLKLKEATRAGVQSQESRASYLAKIQNSYEVYTDLLMRLHKTDPGKGFDGQALEVSERRRARSLIELLSEARADVRQGVDGGLLERERSLGRQLNDKAQHLLEAKTLEQADALKKEISQLENDYERTQADIRKASPHYAALTQPQPLKLTEMQAQLDADTLLLEYSLGDDRSYLWALGRDSLSSYELPKRELIEKNAREVYELMAARSTNRSGETAPQKQERITQAEVKLPAAALELSKTIIGPAAAKLGNKRLIIVADGALQYIPFVMLPVPGAAERPLMVDHEIVSLPSASAQALQRSELDGRQMASKMLAVIADPVFDRTDVRVKAGATGTPDKDDKGQSGPVADSRGLEHIADPSDDKAGRLVIRRLAFTRQEADALLALTPKESSLKETDFEANRTNVTNGDLAQFRYVHFATHGLLDSERPGLSALVLSTVDENGKAREGFLRANDIYNMKLPAELVVLSACQTGLGKEVKGEGLIGLTRGFMYAGAKRVVVSLWSVNDKATADLMAKFYSGMLKNNERPAAALRAAQIEMWKQKKWQSPYYWAAFTMQGEWR